MTSARSGQTATVTASPAGHPSPPRPTRWCWRKAAADGRARPPRRRVEQGRGHHGPLRPRGRRRAGLHADRRRARRHPEQGDGRPEVRADMPASAAPRWPRPRDILGVQQRFLGFVDSGLPEGDPLPPLPDGCFALQPLEPRARGRWCAAVREFRPHVLPTYDENGGYPHPDHIMTHQVVGRGVRGGRRPGPLPGLRRAVAAVEAVLLRDVPPGQVHRAARGDASSAAWSRPSPSGSMDDSGRRHAAAPLGDHDPDPVRRLLRGPRPGTARARHPGRPERALVRLPGGGPAGGLADRGLSSGQ